MGNIDSRDVSSDRMRSTAEADRQILTDTNQNVTGSYLTACASGLIPRNDVDKYHKYQRLLQKMTNLSRFISFAPSSHAYLPEARTKYRKYLQRLSGIHTRNVTRFVNTTNESNDIAEAEMRHEVFMCKIKAAVRDRRRNKPTRNAAEKLGYVCSLFAPDLFKDRTTFNAAIEAARLNLAWKAWIADAPLQVPELIEQPYLDVMHLYWCMLVQHMFGDFESASQSNKHVSRMLLEVLSLAWLLPNSDVQPVSAFDAANVEELEQLRFATNFVLQPIVDGLQNEPRRHFVDERVECDLQGPRNIHDDPLLVCRMRAPEEFAVGAPPRPQPQQPQQAERDFDEDVASEEDESEHAESDQEDSDHENSDEEQDHDGDHDDQHHDQPVPGIDDDDSESGSNSDDSSQHDVDMPDQPAQELQQPELEQAHSPRVNQDDEREAGDEPRTPPRAASPALAPALVPVLAEDAMDDEAQPAQGQMHQHLERLAQAGFRPADLVQLDEHTGMIVLMECVMEKLQVIYSQLYTVDDPNDPFESGLLSLLKLTQQSLCISFAQAIVEQQEINAQSALFLSRQERTRRRRLFFGRACADYCEVILDLAVNLLQQCDSTQPDQLERLLKSGFMVDIVPQVVQCIRSFAFQADFQAVCAERLLPKLSELDRLLSELKPSCDIQSQPSDIKHQIPVFPTKMAESTHRYSPNMDQTVKIEIRGAKFVLVQFDPKCSTESPTDALEIWSTSDPQSTTGPKPAYSTGVTRVTGSSRHWPKTMVFRGDSVCLRFRTGEQQNRNDEYDPQTRAWGYRVYCTGLTASSDTATTSSLYQLRTSTALALSACARVSILLTKSTKTVLDSAVLAAPFLAAPLASRIVATHVSFFCENLLPARLNSCLETVATPSDADLAQVFSLLPSNVQSFWAEKHSEQVFEQTSFAYNWVSELLDNRVDTAIVQLYREMVSMLPRSVTDALGGEITKLTCRMFVATLLQHAHLSELCRSVGTFLQSRAAAATSSTAAKSDAMKDDESSEDEAQPEVLEPLTEWELEHPAQIVWTEAKAKFVMSKILLRFWIAGQNLHSWIVAERSRSQLLMDSQLENLSATLTAAQLVSVKSCLELQYSYQGICFSVLQKLSYLSSLQPTAKIAVGINDDVEQTFKTAAIKKSQRQSVMSMYHSVHSQALSRSTSGMAPLSLSRSNSAAVGGGPLSLSRHNSNAPHELTLTRHNTSDRLKSSVQSLASSMHEDEVIGFDEWSALLMSFVQQPHALSAWVEEKTRQEQRLARRLDALKFVRSAVSRHASQPALALCALSEFSAVFRRFQSGSVFDPLGCDGIGSILQDTHACSSVARVDLQSEFDGFLKELCELVNDSIGAHGIVSETPSSARVGLVALCLDAWMCDHHELSIGMMTQGLSQWLFDPDLQIKLELQPSPLAAGLHEFLLDGSDQGQQLDTHALSSFLFDLKTSVVLLAHPQASPHSVCGISAAFTLNTPVTRMWSDALPQTDSEAQIHCIRRHRLTLTRQLLMRALRLLKAPNHSQWLTLCDVIPTLLHVLLQFPVTALHSLALRLLSQILPLFTDLSMHWPSEELKQVVQACLYGPSQTSPLCPMRLQIQQLRQLMDHRSTVDWTSPAGLVELLMLRTGMMLSLPADIDAAAWSEQAYPSSETRPADMSVDEQGKLYAETCSSLNYESGYTRRAHVSECVQLLRTLWSSAGWSSLVDSTVQTSLQHVSVLLARHCVRLNADSSSHQLELGTWYQSHMALAALALLGGQTLQLNTGVTVEIDQSGADRERGLVLWYDSAQHACTVLFESTPKRATAQFDAARLLVVDDVQHMPCTDLALGHVHALLNLLSVSSLLDSSSVESVPEVTQLLESEMQATRSEETKFQSTQNTSLNTEITDELLKQLSDHLQHVQEQAMAKSTVSLAQSDTSSIQSSVSSLNDRETKRPRLTDDVRNQFLQHLQQLVPQQNAPLIQVIASAPPPVPVAAQPAVSSVSERQVQEVDMTEDEMLAQALALSMEDVPNDDAPPVPQSMPSQPASSQPAEVIQLPAADIASDVVMADVPVPGPVSGPVPSGSSSSTSAPSEPREPAAAYSEAFWNLHRSEANPTGDIDLELARALALSMSESHGIDDRAVEAALSSREAGRWSCEICTYSNPDISEECGMCMAKKPASMQVVEELIALPSPPAAPTALVIESSPIKTVSLSKFEPSSVSLHHLNMRSMILQVLSVWLSHSKMWSTLLGNRDLLARFLSAAVTPTDLQEFRSLPQLQQTQSRLFDLLSEQRRGVLPESALARHNDSGSAAGVPFSPLKHVQLSLPTRMEPLETFNRIESIEDVSIWQFVCEPDTQTESAQSSAFYVEAENHGLELRLPPSVANSREFEQFNCCGHAVANALIPNSVPSFYFEMTILSLGQLTSSRKSVSRSSSSTDATSSAPAPASDSGAAQAATQHERTLFPAFHLAIGLHRAGLELSGAPGFNSFAYSAAGSVHWTLNGSQSDLPYGEKAVASVGDVMGCGWDLRKGVIYFTRNGALLPATPFSRVTNARLRPAIWLEAPGAHVRCNFGQAPFVFDFANTLPKGWEAGSKTEVQLSAVQLRRREQAEELSMIMSYPIEICELALERCNEQMEPALSWLMEQGSRELDRMTEAALRHTQRAAEAAPRRSAYESELETDENLTPLQIVSVRNTNLLSSVDQALPRPVMGLRRILSAQPRAAQGALLDEQVDADLPIGLDANEVVLDPMHSQANRYAAEVAAQGGIPSVVAANSFTPVTSSSLHAGQWIQLVLFNASLEPVSSVVCVQHFDSHQAHVSSTIDSMSIRESQRVPLSHCCLAPPDKSLWRGDACSTLLSSDLVDLSPRALSHQYYQTSTALASVSLRRAAQRWLSQAYVDSSDVLLQTLEHNMSVRQDLFKLATLTAAEFLIDSNATNPLLKTLRTLMLQLIERESQSDVPPMPLKVPTEFAFGEQSVMRVHKISQTSQSVAELCALHLVQATLHPPRVATHASKHSPYEAHADTVERVHISGATQIRIEFDERCHLSTDMLTRLAIYRDQQCQDLLLSLSGSFTGSSGNRPWPASFVVNSSQCFVKFKTSIDNHYWGYRFKVRAVSIRVNDLDALRGCHGATGMWLLDMLLDSSLPLCHSISLARVLVWFVRFGPTNFKQRAIAVLTRFVALITQHPEYRGAAMLPYMNDLLETLEGKLAATSETWTTQSASRLNRQNGESALTQLMQSSEARALLELGAVASSVANQNAVSTESSSSTELAAKVDMSNLYQYKLRVVWATCGEIDLTAQLQELIDTEGGGSLLVLPESHVLLKPLLGSANALHLFYVIERRVLDRAGQIRVERSELQCRMLGFRPLASIYGGTSALWEQHRQLPLSFYRLVQVSTRSARIHCFRSSDAKPDQSSGTLVLSASSSWMDRLKDLSACCDAGSSVQISMVWEAARYDSLVRSQGIPLVRHVRFEHRTEVERSQEKNEFGTVSEPLANAAQSTLCAVVSSPLAPQRRFSFTFWLYLPAINLLSGSNNDAFQMNLITWGVPSVARSNQAYFGSGCVRIRLRFGPLRHGATERQIELELSMEDTDHTGVLSHEMQLRVGDESEYSQLPQQSVDVLSQSLPNKVICDVWTHVGVSTDGSSMNMFLNGHSIAQKQINDRPGGANMYMPLETLFIGPGMPLGTLERPELFAATEPPKVVPFIGQMSDVRIHYRTLDQQDCAAMVLTMMQQLQKKHSGESRSAVLAALKMNFIAPVEDRVSPFEIDRKTVQKAMDCMVRFTPAQDQALISAFSDSAERYFVQRRDELEASRRLVRLGGDAIQIADVESCWQLFHLSGVLGSAPSLMQVDLLRVQLPRLSLQAQPLLNPFDMDTLLMRFSQLRFFNFRVARLVQFVDFGSHSNFANSGTGVSLAQKLTLNASMVFLEIKIRPWQTVLEQTSDAGGRCQVRVNRPRATKIRAKAEEAFAQRGSVDTELEIACLKKSVFGQTYRQLHFLSPSVLRSFDRPFRVYYEGEGGTDAGGLFRDLLSNICSDLQSTVQPQQQQQQQQQQLVQHSQFSYLPLFVPCANSRAGFGENQDKYVPNPRCKSQLQLSQLSFVGKLLGMAIRGRHVLNLDWPAAVWKLVLNQFLDRSDVESIDALSAAMLDRLSKCEDDESVAELNLTFSAVSADGRLIDLVLNGAAVPITMSNRQAYIDAVLDYKQTEFTTQCLAIRSGLGTIVPLSLLSMFSWHELEIMACGRREIDIDFLRDNSRMSREISARDQHVVWFWEVLSEFSHTERQAFIRFAWGQSRLPHSAADFTQKFQLLSCPYNDDDHLPISHTCFFQVELPRYSSKHVLKTKLMYAINHCRAIDADYVVEDVNWDDE